MRLQKYIWDNYKNSKSIIGQVYKIKKWGNVSLDKRIHYPEISELFDYFSS